jgi:hypothetical protein
MQTVVKCNFLDNWCVVLRYTVYCCLMLVCCGVSTVMLWGTIVGFLRGECWTNALPLRSE